MQSSRQVLKEESRLCMSVVLHLNKMYVSFTLSLLPVSFIPPLFLLAGIISVDLENMHAG